METENTDFYKKKLLQQYDLIDRMVKKRFTDAGTADEAFLFVMERLERDNWRRVRDYKGTATFTTYITKVVSNLLYDFSDHKFGKFRPPEWIKKMGALWEEIHRRLCRERMSKDDVVYSLTIGSVEDRDPGVVTEAIDVILSRIPDCGKYAKVKLLVTDPDHMKETVSDQQSAANPGTDITNSTAQFISLQEALFAFLTQAGEKGAVLPGEDKQFGEALKNFRSHLKLSAEQRLLLKMIYQDGLNITAAGKRLHLSKDQVHKKHKQLLEHIRQALQTSGLEHELRELMTK